MPIDFEPQIPFEMQEQGGDFWCWLAVACSMDHHFRPGSRRTQCGLASALIPSAGSCCRRNSPPASCDKPGALEVALEEVDQNEPDNPVVGPLSFTALKTAINAGKPVCAYIAWSDGLGDGHFIAITGHRTSGATKYVYVHDSLFGNGVYSYNAVRNNYLSAGGRWTHHYTVAG